MSSLLLKRHPGMRMRELSHKHAHTGWEVNFQKLQNVFPPQKKIFFIFIIIYSRHALKARNKGSWPSFFFISWASGSSSLKSPAAPLVIQNTTWVDKTMLLILWYRAPIRSPLLDRELMTDEGVKLTLMAGPPKNNIAFIVLHRRTCAIS